MSGRSIGLAAVAFAALLGVIAWFFVPPQAETDEEAVRSADRTTNAERPTDSRPPSPEIHPDEDVPQRREDVPLPEEASTEHASEWWNDDEALDAYLRRFRERAPTLPVDQIHGFEGHVARLKEVGDRLASKPDAAVLAPQWEELGELPGAAAMHAANQLIRLDQLASDRFRPGEKEAVLRERPFDLSPEQALSVIVGGPVELGPDGREEAWALYYQWLGVRARLEQGFSALRMADTLARTMPDGTRLAPIPPGSEHLPADFAAVSHQVAEAHRAYRDALAALAFNRGLSAQETPGD